MGDNMTARILQFREPVHDPEPGAFDWPGAPDPDHEDGAVTVFLAICAVICAALGLAFAIARWVG